jgi:hypothetical protein
MLRLVSLPSERNRHWLAQRLHRLPFDAELLNLTDPQLDWLYAQYDLDAAPTPIEKKYQDRVSVLFGDANGR